EPRRFRHVENGHRDLRNENADPKPGAAASVSSSVGGPLRHIAGFPLLEHVVDQHNRLFEVADRLLQFDALLAQGFEALAELGRSDPELGKLPVLEIVEIEHLFDLFERETNLLAAQDELQARPIAIAEQTCPASASRSQEALLLIEAE